MQKIIFLILTLILLIVAIFGIYFIYQISTPANFNGQKEIKVTKGETLKQISQDLNKQGIIKSQKAFMLYVFLRGKQSSLQAGVYAFKPINIISLTKKLIKGKTNAEISLRFIEGWTIKDIANYLAKQKITDCGSCYKNNFLDIAKVNNFKNNYSFLANLPSQSLEGFIFPDTYRFYKDATPNDILKKALDNFEKKLTPALRTEIAAQGKSLYDVIIMASIIEKEVPEEADRKIVSGILWKRLKKKIPLQVDSSLKYIIGKKDKPALTLEELKIDSPYNTYKYRGLPPTPICNPGESAIRAAVYPKKSDYWYYLSTKNGKTIFSKTLDEHNRNVNKYLRDKK